jgi:cephalosporin-C deacetylase-like acetyl esterase
MMKTKVMIWMGVVLATVTMAQEPKVEPQVVLKAKVGFVDATCPPTSVYAAYNALTVPKKMHGDVLAGHTNTPGAVAFMQGAALEHVRVMRGL